MFLVSNLEVSNKFYKDVLGCEVTESWVIRDGFSGLGLKLIQSQIKEKVQPNGIEREENKHIPDVYCYVENWNSLDELNEEFKSKGIFVVVEPWIDQNDGPWKEFAILDPDNYCIPFGGTKGKERLE